MRRELQAWKREAFRASEEYRELLVHRRGSEQAARTKAPFEITYSHAYSSWINPKLDQPFQF